MTMLRLGLAQSHIRQGLLASAARSPRLLSSTRLAPSLSYQSTAGMKVRVVLGGLRDRGGR